VIIALASVPALTEPLITRLLSAIPPAAATGRPPIRPPQILSGIVWVMRTGASWREVPPAFGPWQTV
jgi:transposase